MACGSLPDRGPRVEPQAGPISVTAHHTACAGLRRFRPKGRDFDRQPGQDLCGLWLPLIAPPARTNFPRSSGARCRPTCAGRRCVREAPRSEGRRKRSMRTCPARAATCSAPSLALLTSCGAGRTPRPVSPACCLGDSPGQGLQRRMVPPLRDEPQPWVAPYASWVRRMAGYADRRDG